MEEIKKENSIKQTKKINKKIQLKISHKLANKNHKIINQGIAREKPEKKHSNIRVK